MIGAVARKLFGSANERRIRSYLPRVQEINALEKELEALSDDALKARTGEFKKQAAEGASLDDLLVPAFATVREAAKRTLGQRHFDVQLIGGMILHEGKISEMKTGEGKTLVATLPVYLNAISGRGVHVVTVNDYLAKRDAEWMGQIYNFLGLSVGVIVHGLDDEQRKKAYDCDITYGTNNELGFDYLRDGFFPLAILVLSAVSALTPLGLTTLNNSGPHGLSEILYAFTSGTGNNGSAFAGLGANRWYNMAMGFTMLIGRFLMISHAGCSRQSRPQEDCSAFTGHVPCNHATVHHAPGKRDHHPGRVNIFSRAQPGACFGALADACRKNLLEGLQCS